jgi:ABC-2 type transport system permease protein
VIALLRSELRKMRTTRTNLGLLLGLVALVLFGVVAGGLTDSKSDLSLPENQRLLIGNGGFAAVFATLVGVMAMTSEFRHGTIRATFVFTPARIRVVVSKALASLLVGAGFGALGVGLALASGAVVIRARGFDLLIDAGDVRRLALGTIVMSALWAALGVGIGAVLRNQVLAVVGVLVWAFVVELLIYEFLPGVGRYAPVAAGTAITGDSFGDSPIELLSAPAGAALLAGYAAALVVAGALVTARRDVT